MYTQKKAIENTHIVRERDRERFREMLAVLTLAVPLGLFLLLFTWQNLEVIRLGRRATELRGKRTELERQYRELRLEAQRATALAQVEKQASSMGLERAEPSHVVTVRAGRGEASR